MSHVIDQLNCTCCHRCRVECPSEAIRFKNSKYWIDPEKCVDCGHCIEVCHNECISGPEPAAKAAPHGLIKKSCDVVVIGAGAAGTAAAAKAAKAGKKVILLEKGHEVGGSAWYAHMFRSYYSKWHEAEGVEDPRPALVKEFAEKTAGRRDPQLFKNVMDANVEMVNMLIDDYDLGKDYVLGFFGPGHMKNLVSTYEEPYNALRIDTMIGPGGNGWYLTRKLQSVLESLGGETLYKTSAKKLLLDDSGAVCGVIAEDGGGEIEIACKACVVAAGSYTRNRELMARFQPLFYQDEGKEPVHVFTCSLCTGDGITMCEEIGADIDYKNKRAAMFGPMRHPYTCVSLAACMGSGRGSFSVNKNGELYVQNMGFGERGEVSDLVNQPGWYVWSICDYKGVKESIDRANARSKVDKDVANINLSQYYDRWEEIMDGEIEAGAVVKADSFEELADKLGVDRAVFMASMAKHNESLKNPPPMPMGMPGGEGGPDGGPGGPDGPDGGEGGPGGPGGPFGGPAEPLSVAPFYAFKLKMFHENAIGGMAVDNTTAVLKNGKPIPGLFAAGDNAHGMMLPGSEGVGYIESACSALTYGFSSGYLAGGSAAKYIDK